MNPSQDPTAPTAVVPTAPIQVVEEPAHFDQATADRLAARREYRARLRTFEVTALAVIITAIGLGVAVIVLRAAIWFCTWSP